MALIFWISSVALIFTFLGYPCLIGVLARLFPKQASHAAPLTSQRVSIVLIVFNARNLILERLKNLLAQDYPIFEIVVVCDGCTDDTPEMVSGFGDPRIKLISRASRSGKSGCLNHGIEAATGDIVVLTDVRQQFRVDAISHLIEDFSDSRVGAVSGALEIQSAKESIGKGIGSYWSLEKELRRAESILDSCIGCTGAIYAIRRSLFTPIPVDTLLDDVVIPMQIALSGYRIAFNPRAVAFDPQPLSPDRESVRKRRTLAGNFQILFRYAQWMLPWKNRLWMQLIAHKYLRLVAPIFLITLLVANFFLLKHWVYIGAFTLQLGVYLLGILGGFPYLNRFRLFSLPASFLFLNRMVLCGLTDYLVSPITGTWESGPGSVPKAGKEHAASKSSSKAL